MECFPQYNADMQRFAGVLYEMNELDCPKIVFLQSVGYDINDPIKYLDRVIGTPLDDQMLALRKRQSEIDTIMSIELDMLIEKGYSGYQLPSRSDFDNFIDWREYFRAPAVTGGTSP